MRGNTELKRNTWNELVDGDTLTLCFREYPLLFSLPFEETLSEQQEDGIPGSPHLDVERESDIELDLSEPTRIYLKDVSSESDFLGSDSTEMSEKEAEAPITSIKKTKRKFTEPKPAKPKRVKQMKAVKKRKTTAYGIYAKRNRKAMKLRHPEKDNAGITKMLRGNYKDLDKDEKKEYTAEAKAHNDSIAENPPSTEDEQELVNPLVIESDDEDQLMDDAGAQDSESSDVQIVEREAESEATMSPPPTSFLVQGIASSHKLFSIDDSDSE